MPARSSTWRAGTASTCRITEQVVAVVHEGVSVRDDDAARCCRAPASSERHLARAHGLAGPARRARSRSGHRSSTSSMPTDRRSRLSGTVGDSCGVPAAALQHRLDAAEAGRVQPQPHGRRAAPARRPSAPPRTSTRMIAPNPFICAARPGVPGVVRQRGVPHPLDRRVVLQAPGQLGRVACGALDAQVQRAQAAQRQPRLPRAGDGAVQRAVRLQPPRRAPASRVTRDAQEDVGVAAEVLGRRVQDDVRAELERPLHQRGRERVVDRERHARGARPRQRSPGGRRPPAAGWSATPAEPGRRRQGRGHGRRCRRRRPPAPRRQPARGQLGGQRPGAGVGRPGHDDDAPQRHQRRATAATHAIPDANARPVPPPSSVRDGGLERRPRRVVPAPVAPVAGRRGAVASPGTWTSGRPAS